MEKATFLNKDIYFSPKPCAVLAGRIATGHSFGRYLTKEELAGFVTKFEDRFRKSPSKTEIEAGLDYELKIYNKFLESDHGKKLDKPKIEGLRNMSSLLENMLVIIRAHQKSKQSTISD